MNNNEKNIKQERRENRFFYTFLLIGIFFPYTINCLSGKSFDLFVWNLEERVILLLFTLGSASFFCSLGLKLSKIRIHSKNTFFYVIIWLIGVYLLSSFIEAEMNIFKWEVILNFENNPFNIIINSFFLVLVIIIVTLAVSQKNEE